jgi:hypothetical protein
MDRDYTKEQGSLNSLDQPFLLDYTTPIGKKPKG